MSRGSARALGALRLPGLIARLAETWIHRPSTPTRAVMDLTRRCNLRCAMCNTWAIEPGHELDAEEVRGLLGQMPGLAWLDLTGGEPFLRADIAEVFDAVLDAAPALGVLHFPTNGWFKDRTVEVARRVRRRRPEIDLIITVSIDGPRALHDRMRGRAGSFDRAIETFRALSSIEGVDVYLGTTVTRDNEAHLPALWEALCAEIDGISPRSWHFNWMQVSSHFFANAHVEPPAPRRGFVWEHLERRGLPRGPVDLMELGFLINLEFYRRGEPTGIVCQALRSAVFISPEGDVYPCHVYDRPLGNLRQTDLQTLWQSDEVRAARRDIERLACGGCFTPCEAYPALAGAPLAAVAQTARRSLRLIGERASDLVAAGVKARAPR